LPHQNYILLAPALTDSLVTARKSWPHGSDRTVGQRVTELEWITWINCDSLISQFWKQSVIKQTACRRVG